MSARAWQFGSVLVGVALVVEACTGGSGGEVVDQASVVAETPTVVATQTPTVQPTEVPSVEPVVLSDEVKIAVAVAAFDADPQPSDLIVWDHLETTVRGENTVDVIVCGWTGESVFDNVHMATYRVLPDEDGEPRVIVESATLRPGDCQNTELVESALQFTRDYETFWSGVLADPPSFDREEARDFWTTEALELNERRVHEWIDDDLSYQNVYYDAQLPESGVTETLERSYVADEVEVFELISCRDIPAGFGLYRGSALLDDFRSESSKGDHATTQFRLVRRDDRWLLAGTDVRVWANCFGFEDGWFAGINQLIANPVSWEQIAR